MWRRPLVAAAACCSLAAAGHGALIQARASQPRAVGAPHSRPSTPLRPQLGAFAGYNFYGRVSTVRGAWMVPAMLPPWSSGFAATWIGAQAPAAHGFGPFIQVGVNEEITPDDGTDYYAFWSDSDHHFHPQFMFDVHPGDDLSASLVLTRGRWQVAITDITAHRQARFSTPDEAQASFNNAEWLQEDVTDGATGRPFPYPQLTTVHFQQLAVDGKSPTADELAPAWMSVARGVIAPTSLQDDGFRVGATAPASAALSYLAQAADEDSATQTFVNQAESWTAHTPAPQVASASAVFVAALRRDIGLLASTSWSPAVQPLVTGLIGNMRVLETRTQTAPEVLPSQRRTWYQSWTADAQAVGDAGVQIRGALNLPPAS